jgi:hypothetical protein
VVDAQRRRPPHVGAGHEMSSPFGVEPSSGAVPADRSHGHGGLAARTTLLIPEMRQRSRHAPSLSTLPTMMVWLTSW